MESPNEPIDPYDQLPRGLREAIAGTRYEARLREAAATGLIPDGYTNHLFLQALGKKDAFNDADREFHAWLEAPTETE